MIKTIVTTTAAMALMTGLAVAQVKTDGGTSKSAASPTSANSGVTQSTGQTQPQAPGAYSTMARTPGLTSTTGSATGGPGTTPNGPATTTGDTTSPPTATVSGGATSASMPAAPTMTANTPTGDAPSTYPRCTHKGQDRCMQRMGRS